MGRDEEEKRRRGGEQGCAMMRRTGRVQGEHVSLLSQVQ